jgi:hypothetical protein
MQRIEDGLKEGKLDSRVGHFHGKSYRKLLRHQLDNFMKLCAQSG